MLMPPAKGIKNHNLGQLITQGVLFKKNGLQGEKRQTIVVDYMREYWLHEQQQKVSVWLNLFMQSFPENNGSNNVNIAHHISTQDDIIAMRYGKYNII